MKENPNYYFVERPYKQKYICVSCRKAFKRRVLADVSKEEREKEPKCPDCGRMTTWIGPKFRAPKSDNVKAWESVKVLRDVGALNTFSGFASENIKLPESSKALKDLLVAIKRYYEQTMRRHVSAKYNDGNKVQIGYLADTVKKINNHLAGM